MIYKIRWPIKKFNVRNCVASTMGTRQTPNTSIIFTHPTRAFEIIKKNFITKKNNDKHSKK